MLVGCPRPAWGVSLGGPSIYRRAGLDGTGCPAYPLGMTEHANTPTPSLIQQRMALERAKHFATNQVICMSVLCLGWIVAIVVDGGSRAWPWIAAAIFAALTAASAFALRAPRRAIRAFEEEHGVGAGVQKPVR